MPELNILKCETQEDAIRFNDEIVKIYSSIIEIAQSSDPRSSYIKKYTQMRLCALQPLLNGSRKCGETNAIRITNSPSTKP